MKRWLAGVVLAAGAALVPSGAVAGNQETAERIAAALAQSGHLHRYQIAVLCQDRTVWLHGNVANREQMDIALQVAFKSPEVRRVVNRLDVVTGDGPQVALRPKAAPTRASRPIVADRLMPLPELPAGKGIDSTVGMSPLRLVADWSDADAPPAPATVIAPARHRRPSP